MTRIETGKSAADGAEEVFRTAAVFDEEVLTSVQRRLNNSSSVGDLLARAPVEGCACCGFARGLVLVVDEGMLTATGIDTVSDPASDAMRRRALADPIPLTQGSEEAELIRRAEGGGRRGPIVTGGLRQIFELEESALAVIAPETRAIALLVLDRPEPAVGEDDLRAVGLFAHMLNTAIERLILRLRMGELSAELRHLTASANALMREALEAPVALPADYGHGPVFTSAGRLSASPRAGDDLLSDRERQIMALMAEGRSNREIGDALHLSADTVKGHVGRLVRKLGASNRVDAVARYIGMDQHSDS